MQLRACAWVVAAVAAFALVAAAAPAQASTTTTSEADAGPGLVQLAVGRFTTFCNQSYALCIRARCVPGVRLTQSITYAQDTAVCECDMRQGWSMGPGSCDDRKVTLDPVTGNSYTISTYSNLYNAVDQTLVCPESRPWAWCYGAPCVVDSKDPSKAWCTCPVTTSSYATLGGDCDRTSCSDLWSAATLVNDAFANNFFYNQVKKLDPNYPANPPAKQCPVPTKKPTRRRG